MTAVALGFLLAGPHVEDVAVADTDSGSTSANRVPAARSRTTGERSRPPPSCLPCASAAVGARTGPQRVPRTRSPPRACNSLEPRAGRHGRDTRPSSAAPWHAGCRVRSTEPAVTRHLASAGSYPADRQRKPLGPQRVRSLSTARPVRRHDRSAAQHPLSLVTPPHRRRRDWRSPNDTSRGCHRRRPRAGSGRLGRLNPQMPSPMSSTAASIG